jgi:hypothetical protein
MVAVVRREITLLTFRFNVAFIFFTPILDSYLSSRLLLSGVGGGGKAAGL